MRFISSTTKILLIVSFVALAIAPLAPAQAASPSIVDRATNIISNVVQLPTNITLFTIFFTLSKGVALFAQLFNAVLRYSIDPNMIVVVTLWRIIRDLSNMMFIVILIIMAFSTIFDLDSLGIPGISGAKASGALIVKFIVAALLINFSLTIGGLIITGADSVNKIFLTSIGDVSDRLGQAIVPASSILQLKVPSVQESLDAAASIAKTATEQGGLTLTLQLIAAIILSFILLFLLITAAVFVIWRLPYLMYLLIISPIAWLGMILPSTRSVSKKWWQEFIGWNIYLPVFLFFLYIGMYILSQEKILVASFAGQNSQSLSQQFVSGLSLPLSTIFYYIFVGFVLVGSMKIARDAAKGGGEGVVNAVEAGRNFAYGLPVFSQYRAAEGAAQTQIKELQEKGLSTKFGFDAFGKRFSLNDLYAGKEGKERDIRNAQSRIFGRKAAPLKTQTEFAGNVDKRLGELRDLEKTGGVVIDGEFIKRTAGMSPLDTEGAARRALLYERGQMDGKEFTKDMTALINTSPLAAESLVDKAVKANFKDVKAEQLLAMASGENDPRYGNFSGLKMNPQAIGVRRKLFKFLQEKDAANEKAFQAITPDQLKEAIAIFGGENTNEAANFRKTVAGKRPDVVAAYDVEKRGLRPGTPAYNSALNGAIFKEIRNKDSKEIADILDNAWKSGNFQNAVKQKATVLERQNPSLPEGKIFPPGTPTPTGITEFKPGQAIPAGVNGAYRLKDGKLLFPQGIRVPAGLTGFKLFKGKTGSGESFKTSLEEATRKTPGKNRIAATF